MKRILSMIAAVVLVSAVAQAEEMSFVTVLSSPLGSFSNLETANVSEVKTLNVSAPETAPVDMELRAKKDGEGKFFFKVALVGSGATFKVEDAPQINVTYPAGVSLANGELTGGQLGGGISDRVETVEMSNNGTVRYNKGLILTNDSEVVGARTNALYIGTSADKISGEFQAQITPNDDIKNKTLSWKQEGGSKWILQETKD